MTSSAANSKQWRHAGISILKSRWTFVLLAYGQPAPTADCAVVHFKYNNETHIYIDISINTWGL